MTIQHQAATRYEDVLIARRRDRRNMHHAINSHSDDSMNAPEASRVNEIDIAQDGASFSITVPNGANGPAQVSLVAGELPRLIVALLRTAELLERVRGDERSLAFSIEKGSIALWEDAFIFRVTLTEGASMMFRLSRGAAASLFETLTTAVHSSTFLRSAAH
jgi:hypothetical protein